MTAHGLRGTAFMILFVVGFNDANFAMETGHQDICSLQSYHNLQGDLKKV